MLGAISGDIIGAPYEFDYNNIKTTDFPLFNELSEFTDDTVMSVAVANALVNTYGKDDETIKAELVSQMQTLGRMHPGAGYGGRFCRWIFSDNPQPYNSFGNGSAMRVSSAGWLYDTLEDTLHAAHLTAEVTHNHPEGIKGAESTAAAIFLARNGKNKEDIRDYIVENFGYDLDTTLDEIRPSYHMDETCQGSVPQAIRAFLEGSDYESTVRLAVSIGGDSDTIACIAGSIAEAYYGMPENLRVEAVNRLSEDLRKDVLKYLDFLNSKN